MTSTSRQSNKIGGFAWLTVRKNKRIPCNVSLLYCCTRTYHIPGIVEAGFAVCQLQLTLVMDFHGLLSAVVQDQGRSLRNRPAVEYVRVGVSSKCTDELEIG